MPPAGPTRHTASRNPSAQAARRGTDGHPREQTCNLGARDAARVSQIFRGPPWPRARAASAAHRVAPRTEAAGLPVEHARDRRDVEVTVEAGWTRGPGRARGVSQLWRLS